MNADFDLGKNYGSIRRSVRRFGAAVAADLDSSIRSFEGPNNRAAPSSIVKYKNKDFF
ncbi:hypothetical protein [Sulfuracidifex tepidarius]|uniref:Uncharacterized protein n=2 Tax=Sulfuracidifex tepidarius TaxID=1294262 RepID=A0A510DU16_9CREN|nr:hypothetical protein [Sulfuracidifex tepidarius]BBG23657.1 hypothetical protein IC006_0945 [Sulfuracidifex tepidarius]BBG26404.1 hypothetical protein IC007_0912 [Sulfuracidifex tepidarius]